MNKNFLLDREYFNINTRNGNIDNKKNVKNENHKNDSIHYLDRNQFSKIEDNIEEKEYKNNNDNYDKINDIRFNNYQNQYRNEIKTERIEYDNNKKEEIYYKPYERNIHIEKNIEMNQMDFTEKNKKTKYYKGIKLDKYDPNINYKDFI